MTEIQNQTEVDQPIPFKVPAIPIFNSVKWIAAVAVSATGPAEYPVTVTVPAPPQAARFTAGIAFAIIGHLILSEDVVLKHLPSVFLPIPHVVILRLRQNKCIVP